MLQTSIFVPSLNYEQVTTVLQFNETLNMSQYYVSGHYTSSYVFNIVFELLVILTYDLRLVDQTTNDSPLHVMWVVGHEVQTTTCMNRLPIRWIMSRKIVFILREPGGRAIAQAVIRWLPPRQPGFAPGSGKWDLWWT
jgi:hypothetical protein